MYCIGCMIDLHCHRVQSVLNNTKIILANSFYIFALSSLNGFTHPDHFLGAVFLTVTLLMPLELACVVQADDEVIGN
jgi:hypothetical protein